MPTYQLQIKQVVDYPRCRIYRQFVRFLMEDRSIRVSGGSGLFYFTVLCSYANFRTSYRRIDGISYTVYPGEWVCTLKELSQWFRTRFQCQALAVLERLQKCYGTNRCIWPSHARACPERGPVKTAICLFRPDGAFRQHPAGLLPGMGPR